MRVGKVCKKSKTKFVDVLIYIPKCRFNARLSKIGCAQYLKHAFIFPLLETNIQPEVAGI